MRGCRLRRSDGLAVALAVVALAPTFSAPPWAPWLSLTHRQGLALYDAVVPLLAVCLVWAIRRERGRRP